MITFYDIFWQRWQFARKIGYTMQNAGELDKFANYFAPDQWTLWDHINGDQKDLWDNRWEDGEVWSAFLARDVKRLFNVS